RRDRLQLDRALGLALDSGRDRVLDPALGRSRGALGRAGQAETRAGQSADGIDRRIERLAYVLRGWALSVALLVQHLEQGVDLCLGLLDLDEERAEELRRGVVCGTLRGRQCGRGGVRRLRGPRAQGGALVVPSRVARAAVRDRDARDGSDQGAGGLLAVEPDDLREATECAVLLGPRPQLVPEALHETAREPEAVAQPREAFEAALGLDQPGHEVEILAGVLQRTQREVAHLAPFRGHEVALLLLRVGLGLPFRVARGGALLLDAVVGRIGRTSQIRPGPSCARDRLLDCLDVEDAEPHSFFPFSPWPPP